MNDKKEGERKKFFDDEGIVLENALNPLDKLIRIVSCKHSERDICQVK